MGACRYAGVSLARCEQAPWLAQLSASDISPRSDILCHEPELDRCQSSERCHRRGLCQGCNSVQPYRESFLCYNLLVSTNTPTYAIDILPVGDHLQVTIPDLGIVLE